MPFTPQQYSIPDRPGEPFLDPAEIRDILQQYADPTPAQISKAIGSALNLKRLTLDQTAILLNAGERHIGRIREAAAQLKSEVYGNRIVVFAPLYIGNRCINNCAYCGFKASNRLAIRNTLTEEQIAAEVTELESTGQKRLILVYGEHPDYSAEFIARNVQQIYAIHRGAGSINRVNINAAPMSVEDFRTVKEAGIGTFQVFQETYDPEVYAKVHPSGPKSDYDYRLTSMDRAMQAGIDDVGLGVLGGLADWKFEVMALVRHANHLEACFGVGPHTISFPRIKRASGVGEDKFNYINDSDFERMVCVLRLAVPYTGLILTARENAEIRDRLIPCGITQIDAGSRIEIGGYTTPGDQSLDREQFEIGDTRSLLGMAENLTMQGTMLSFCTACYRKNRTGECFMDLSTRGFIKRFCTPNAILSFAEYLEDYAPGLREKGYALIEKELAKLGGEARQNIEKNLKAIRAGERDLLV